MTDKKNNFDKDINVPSKEQIIIDGVDVSKCISFNKCNGKNLCCYDDTREDKIPFANFCVENKDCYFKQLAHKTQECEELKEKLYQIEDVVKPINEQLPEDSVIRQIMLILNDCNKLEPSRYRKALEEIEQELKENIYCESQECGCDDFEECLRCTKDLILDIINKAKGRNNDR